MALTTQNLNRERQKLINQVDFADTATGTSKSIAAIPLD
jgi:hypothetical protein